MAVVTAARDGAQADLAAAREAAAAARDAAARVSEGLASEQSSTAALSARLRDQVLANLNPGSLRYSFWMMIPSVIPPGSYSFLGSTAPVERLVCLKRLKP